MHRRHELAELRGGGGSEMDSGLVREEVGVASHQREGEGAEDSTCSLVGEVLLMKIVTCTHIKLHNSQRLRQREQLLV